MGMHGELPRNTKMASAVVIETSADTGIKLNKFQLPDVQFSGSSLQLNSQFELEVREENKYGSQFWNYICNEAPAAPPQMLPTASNLTSLTYVGERRAHPQFRMRIYEILQHRASHQ